ncbi:MAG: ABC transporter permease [Gemmatimonadaceae bacterium]
MHSVLKRVGSAALIVWTVLTLTFILVRGAPGDAATLLIPPGASADDGTRIRADLGLDATMAVQYARWSRRVLRGDLGESLISRRRVSAVLAEAFVPSVLLGGASLAFSYLVGVVLGFAQAARLHRRVDVAFTVALAALYAAPAYWLSLALTAVFTVGAAAWGFPPWARLPAFGMRSPGAAGHGLPAVIDLVRHALLPVAVLTAIGAAGVARYARAAAAGVMNEDWARTARAKGAATARVYGYHILGNAVPPLVVLFALALPGIAAGSVFVEQVFAWPGVGRVLVNAIRGRDYPVVMGATALYAALVVAANLVADLMLPIVDPRRRSA